MLNVTLLKQMQSCSRSCFQCTQKLQNALNYVAYLIEFYIKNKNVNCKRRLFFHIFKEQDVRLFYANIFVVRAESFLSTNFAIQI